MASVKEEFSDTRSKVEYVLKRFKGARDGGPLKTVILVWKYCDGVDLDINAFLSFNKKTDFETIRRTRQRLQNTENRFLPSLKTKQERKQREKEIKRLMR